MNNKKMVIAMVMLAVSPGLLLPTALSAASLPSETKQKELIQDVALQTGGVFNGSLVDAKGSPIAAADVSLLYDNKPLATAKTDKQGKFAFTGLRGGMYQLVANDTHRLYRLWAEGTSPKSAGQVAHVVVGQDVIRGQFTAGRVGKILTSPLGITAIVATAIAVPVALHNSDRDSSH